MDNRIDQVKRARPLPTKKPSARNLRRVANKQARKKPILKHRYYILPSGTEIYIFGRWDRYSHVGKVVADDQQCGNLVVSDSVLRTLEPIPKGSETFIPDIAR